LIRLPPIFRPHLLRRWAVHGGERALFEAEVIGKTDADVHSERVARETRGDDLRVMRSLEPLVDRVEALFIRSQAKESKSSLWRRMTKVSATAGLTMTWN
jgi:hypothetical protein